MTGPSPVAFLEGAPWKAALFTTYALSLSFFESVVLHRLRRAGCREIWVIVDAQGYRSSLMERRSAQVGQTYRLIPVALPNGVFHPKCTYLTGDDGDLLLVGSGNLTFGGYGRNIEVLDEITDLTQRALGQLGKFRVVVPNATRGCRALATIRGIPTKENAHMVENRETGTDAAEDFTSGQLLSLTLSHGSLTE